MKIKENLTIFFISVIAMLILFQTDINAEAIPDISRALIASQLDYRVDNFNGNSAPSWVPANNVNTVNIAQAIAGYPFKPFDGAGCLAVQSESAVLNGWRYITKTYTTPYNFSESNVIFAAINMPELADSYEVTLIMEGYSSTVSGCKSGTWCGVFFDISNYSGKSEINYITIGVRYNSEVNYNSEYIYYIDMIGGFRNANISETIKYLSSDFYTSGGTLVKNADSMILEITDENPYIETYSFNPEILSDENINSIKLKFKNNSDCQAVSFFYTTARNPAFSQERSYIIAAETEGDVQICYFPMTANSISSIDQIRILFNGATHGNIEILSITPSSAYIPSSTGYGTVDECTISSNKKEIHISGTLTEDAYNEFRGVYLELYAIGINEDTDNVINHNLTPVAQVRAERSFNFSIPFDNTVKYLISSKFIVVADTGTERFIIDKPKYITNPEILAVNKYTNEKSSIKKGMTSQITESQILGVKYTYITINIANLITFDETGYQHTIDGYTYYFAADYITQLDDSLKQYYKAGIIVTAVLNLKSVSESQVNNIFIHPDADRTRNVNGYALNTTTAESIRYLRAVFDFLAHRYSSDDTSYGRIANYVIGNKVGNAYMNYNMGEKNLLQFVESYSAAVRLAYNTIKSVSSAAGIYISLDYKWDNDMPADNRLMYDNRVLLDALSAYFKGHGDINWNLAFDMYPDTINTEYKPWNDPNAVNSYDTGVITARNIETLCRYMSRQQLWYISNATPRSVLLIEQTSVPTDAASFVYSFYKINMRACSLIEAYIINRSNDQNFQTVFRNIDTNKSFETTDYLKEDLGISEWAEVINYFDTTLIIRRNITDMAWTSDLPRNTTGSAVLWQFSEPDNTDGWQTAEYCDFVTSGNQFYNRSSLLKAQLTKSPIYTEYRGIENVLSFATDLSAAPYLSFNIQISTLPTNVTSAELVLFIQSGESYIQSNGIINAGNWNTVVLDMSSFSGLKSIDNMKIWFRGINGQTDLGDPVIFVSDMTVHSMEYESEVIINNLQKQRELHLSTYEPTIDMRYVWILITIIIVATTLLTINILSRRKLTDQEEYWDDGKY